MQHKATYCWKKFSKWIKVKLALGLISYYYSLAIIQLQTKREVTEFWNYVYY